MERSRQTAPFLDGSYLQFLNKYRMLNVIGCVCD